MVHPIEIIKLLEQIQKVRSEQQFRDVQSDIPYIINRIYASGIGEE
jgi:hypothetical protein